MTTPISAILCATALCVGAPHVTEKPEAESQLEQVTEVHVIPGMALRFEEALAARNERMAGGVSFLSRTSVSETLVYRFVTPVGDLNGLAQLNDEMGNLGPALPGAPNGNEAIDRIDTYVRLSRPDLGYAPENPRLDPSEFRAVQRFRVFVRQGKVEEYSNLLRDVAALYRKHGVVDGFDVHIQETGPDAPIIEVQVFGSSVADIYQTGEQLEMISDEMDEIRSRVEPVARRFEVDVFTIRPDLGDEQAH